MVQPTHLSLESRLNSASDQIIPLSFATSMGERAFTAEDAAFAHALVNLPEKGRLPLAFVAGELSGADLALALLCPFIGLEHSATLSTGFGRPGSAAVYVAASRRIGPVSCERLLFRASSATAREANNAHLAEVVESQEAALAFADQRLTTMISVVRANLVTWPMPLTRLQALID